MKQIIKLFRIVHIDVFVYKIDNQLQFSTPNFKYKIEKNLVKKKWCYTINEGDTLVHKSYVFEKVHLLRLFNKKGPVIGDCYTNKSYRGQAIYPNVINRIANEILNNQAKEIFMVVNQDNKSSIRGIEKAGFTKFADVKSSRWLCFYFSKRITHYYNNFI